MAKNGLLGERFTRKDILDNGEIVATLNRLCLRIEDRFPDSGLSGVGRKLHGISQETDRIVRWIQKPNYFYRCFSVLFVLLIVAVLGFALSQLELKNDLGLTDFVAVSEAAINELILVGVALVFIVTFEVRQKRKRVIAALNQLRSIAHVIDAHQLTKDPESTLEPHRTTKHSPKRGLDAYQLNRYLDYCSELLSLTSKVAFLYVQKFDDPVSLSAVNELENLTMGLSRKAWQKIMILHSMESDARARGIDSPTQ